MAAGGDLIELVHSQTYLGQEVHNVYFFEAVTTGASLQDLADWFELNVVPDIKALQVDLVEHNLLSLRNLFDLGEVIEEPLTGTGAINATDTELPAFFAYTFRLDHSNAVVRPGFKRYTGATEANISDSLWLAGTVSGLSAVADNLVNPPVDPNVDWAHVIVNRVCEIPNPTAGAVPSCLKYRLPENQGESNPGYPTAYEVYVQPTTQNSRKWYT